MFITNNHATFHLRRKKNLVKYQKVSEYYDHDFLQNFFCFLLTAPNAIKSHILAGIYYIFRKESARKNLKDFQYQIWTSVKSELIGKVVIK